MVTDGIVVGARPAIPSGSLTEGCNLGSDRPGERARRGTQQPMPIYTLGDMVPELPDINQIWIAPAPTSLAA